VGLTTSALSVSRLSRQCGIFNISQPYRPQRPVTGIALLFLRVKNVFFNSSKSFCFEDITCMVSKSNGAFRGTCLRLQG
jgi:hypothetical protein